MPLTVSTLFVGAGPAGLGPLVWAAQHGVLARVAQEGLVVVDRSSHIGAGALVDHAIGSDTLAETFIECLADGAEPRLMALRDHEATLQLATYAGGAAPLPVAAAFMAVLGSTMHEILLSHRAVVLLEHDADHSRRSSDGKWITRVVGRDGRTQDIASERLILATGADQRLEDVAHERIGSRKLLPALADKLMLSGDVLAHGGGARVAARLAGNDSPKIAIIGSSHSAMASANVVLSQDTNIRLGREAVSLLHRRPLRIYYPTVEAAQAEGYTDFNERDVCPRTRRLFRLAGFRLSARELARRVLGVGNAPEEPRVRLCRLSGSDDDAKAWDVLDEADLVIAALGYRPRALRLLDSTGSTIELGAHAARGAALVDRECRVLDVWQEPVEGVFALGLAAGFVPWGAMGGEPSFRGQTNGLWLWQNDIGAMIVQQCLRRRSDRARRRVARLHAAVIVGTRPEAIKLAPVILALRDTAGVTVSTWCTGQHPEWAPRTLGYFGLNPDRTIESTDTGSGLSRLAGTLLLGLQAALQEARPDVVIVQGDTASAFMGTLAAGYAGIPVVHVEAGLRSGDRRTPFPEEAHRRGIAQFTALHCAPTEVAADHLRREGIDARDILLCGNTVIDALHHTMQAMPASEFEVAEDGSELPLLLLTCHRRESWGAGFISICAAMRRIAQRGDSRIVFVLHPNPALALVASRMLSSIPSVKLIPPQGYPQFVGLMRQAAVILTDSGGVQEEATALGIPLMVLRENTERPEALAAPHARIVGTKEADIVAAVAALLDDPETLSAPRVPSTVYGDGHAARRIAEVIVQRWKGSDRRARASADAPATPSAVPATAQINAAAAARALREPLSA